MSLKHEVETRQADVEFIIFIDQCSFYNKQLGCIKALNKLAKASGGRLKVSLGTTDQDYREKTDYRDPAHAEAGITEGDVGYKFARFIFSNPSMTKFFNTDYGTNFIDVFRKEVVAKELLTTPGHRGLLDIIEHELAAHKHIDDTPVKSFHHLKESDPLFRLKDKGITYTDLHGMMTGLKKSLYASLRSTHDKEALAGLGIKTADDITMKKIRTFLAEAEPSFALQMLVDSRQIYYTLINTNEAFRKARNHAGENAVFEITGKLGEELDAMPPAKRAQFGKKVVAIYICDDGPAWKKYIETVNAAVSTPNQQHPAQDKSIDFTLMGMKGFVEFVHNISSRLKPLLDVKKKNRITTPEFQKALDDLKEAKKELHEQMHKKNGTNGKNDDRHNRPMDFSPEHFFTERIESELKEIKEGRV